MVKLNMTKLFLVSCTTLIALLSACQKSKPIRTTQTPTATHLPNPVSHQPNSAFGNYANSEAEALYQSRINRLASGGWIDGVFINHQYVSILAGDIPREQVRAYVIQDANLAQRLGLTPGNALTEEQVRRHPEMDAIMDGVYDGQSVIVDDNAVHPAYNPRPITYAMQNNLDHVRNEIQRRIQELDRNTLGGFYISPTAGDGTLWVNHGDSSPGIAGQNTQTEFTNLLEVIRTSNAARPQESEFIELTVRLATKFSRNHIQAKNGFIEVMTMLFVSKNFPSEGARQNYLHFFLRCGHLHT